MPVLDLSAAPSITVRPFPVKHPKILRENHISGAEAFRHA
jgi:hypothetical protein